MTEEQVDRVARAIALADPALSARPSEWDMMNTPARLGFMDMARAAIAATQPTPQERREWNPSDGDRICQKCGTDNPVWFAPSPIWNCLMGGPDATDDPGGVLCPTCFMALDDDQIWEVRPKAQPTPQEAAMKLALKALDEAHSECRDYADTHPFIKQLDEAREALRAIAWEDKT